MDSPRPHLIILADAPEALRMLFGISFLERLLRTTQRLGFRETLISSETPDEIEAHLARPSWARAELALTVRRRQTGPVRVRDVASDADAVLVVSAGFYFDSRLLRTMADQRAATLLVDTDPPSETRPLWDRPLPDFRGAALLDRDWFTGRPADAPLVDQLAADSTGRVHLCDASREPTYVTSLRKHVRPVFFPAPSIELVSLAEKFPRDVAQNGVLDFPGFLDSPIEDWIVARLCRTSIRPNHVTVATMGIGVAVTVLFATGHLWWGCALAYAIEVLDGVDGKLARTKVETTAVGEWEHQTDYLIELSWWTALAFHFFKEGLSSAFWLLGLYVGSDLLDRLAKRSVKKKVARNLDDVSNFDRFVRCIGARRNINIWILIAALALRDATSGFVLICGWGAVTAAAHIVRAFQIRVSPSSTA